MTVEMQGRAEWTSPRVFVLVDAARSEAGDGGAFSDTSEGEPIGRFSV